MKRRELLLLVLSVAVGVLVFEAAVRGLGLDYDLSPNWKFHPLLGWSQVPGGTYDTVVDGRPVHVAFNASGFRDIERAVAKPPGVKRVVVVGDSFSEAIQVNFEETFQQRLQQELEAGGGERWEVINLGVGDFGTAQAYLALVHHGLGFDPDVVIHQVFPLNDICNNSIELYGLCGSHNDRYRPYFVESAGELRQTSAQPVRNFLRRHLVSYGVAEHAILKLLLPGPHSPHDPLRIARQIWHGYDGLDPILMTYSKPEDQAPAVADGWRITEKLIERMVEVTQQRGVAFIGMVVPFEQRIGPNWDAFARGQRPPPMVRDQPERRLSAHFERLGVPSVMLLETFDRHVEDVLPYVGGHLSIGGHRRAAEALHRAMLEAGLAAARPTSPPQSAPAAE